MMFCLIYPAIGMLTLFLACVQILRQENAGENFDKHDEEDGDLWPLAALIAWPMCLPMVLAYLLFWKPGKVEVAQ